MSRRRRIVSSILARADRVALAAGAVIVAYLLVVGLVDVPAGTSRAADLARVAVPATVVAAVALSFSRLRRGVAAWVAFVFGALALVEGALRFAHIRRAGDVGLADVTGIAVGVAGVALLVLAVALASRPKAPRGHGRRWLARAVVLAGTAVTTLFVVMPVGVAVYLVDKGPRHVPETALAIPHERVTLETSDGLKLAAWYVPSRNGAAVVLVHGAGGDRAGGIRSRATMLARHGYGVLLYDARGGGDSQGRLESIGWTWHRDVAAAVDFLARRGIERVGALGLSTGAEAVLEAAGRDRRIDAVVAEGAQARSVTEMRLLPRTGGNAFYTAYWGGVLAAYRVLSLEKPAPSLATMVARIAPRPIFLISSGRGFEHDMNRAYAAKARGPVTLWEMPEAQHTAGLATYPHVYDRRVTRFFDRALLDVKAGAESRPGPETFGVRRR